MKTYSEKLKDPRWQKKRLEILQRDNWTCQHCQSKEKTLHVHHKYYTKNTEPWDYPNKAFVAYCESCHETISKYWPKIESSILSALRENFKLCDLTILLEIIRQINNSKTIVTNLCMINNILEYKPLNDIVFYLDNPDIAIPEEIIELCKNFHTKVIEENNG